MPDFLLQDGGSIVLLYPQNNDAKAWIKHNLSLNDWQNPCRIAIEPRYIEDIVCGVRGDGLRIEQF